MGSAISLFERAAAVRVNRRRFSPVKNTNDLLAMRSDAYLLTDDWRMVLSPDRSAPPVVSLDDTYYKMIGDFEARFPGGPPSLVRCESLTVNGDVTFSQRVTAEGRVRVVACEGPKTIKPGSVLSGDIEL
jgi:UTP--glucose-1-phosphate uridylyltransferase